MKSADLGLDSLSGTQILFLSATLVTKCRTFVNINLGNGLACAKRDNRWKDSGENSEGGKKTNREQNMIKKCPTLGLCARSDVSDEI